MVGINLNEYRIKKREWKFNLCQRQPIHPIEWEIALNLLIKYRIQASVLTAVFTTSHFNFIDRSIVIRCPISTGRNYIRWGGYFVGAKAKLIRCDIPFFSHMNNFIATFKPNATSHNTNTISPEKWATFNLIHCCVLAVRSRMQTMFEEETRGKRDISIFIRNFD